MQGGFFLAWSNIAWRFFYAIILLLLTSLYAIKGGMVSVVITEVMQFILLTVTSLIIGCIAIHKVSPEMIIPSSRPAGSVRSSAGSSAWTGPASWTRSTTPSGRTATNSSPSSSA